MNQLTLAISNIDSTSETACEANGTLAMSATSFANCAMVCTASNTVSLRTRKREGRDTSDVDMLNRGGGKLQHRGARQVLINIYMIDQYSQASALNSILEIASKTRISTLSPQALDMMHDGLADDQDQRNRLRFTQRELPPVVLFILSSL